MGIKRNELICGTHPVAEALKSGVNIMKILIKRGINRERISEIITTAHSIHIFVQEVPAEKLDRIAGTNHQGIIAIISPVEFQSIEQLLPSLYESGNAPFVLLLDGVTDVRNLGAVARTAECFGVDAIILPQKGSALPGKDAVKSSAGALLKIPLCRVESLIKSVEFLQLSGIQVLGLTEKAKENIHECDLTIPTALILGSEGEGISNSLLRKADHLVAISMSGSIASLNISVAAGIGMYEVQRQRAN